MAWLQGGSFWNIIIPETLTCYAVEQWSLCVQNWGLMVNTCDFSSLSALCSPGVSNKEGSVEQRKWSGQKITELHKQERRTVYVAECLHRLSLLELLSSRQLEVKWEEESHPSFSMHHDLTLEGVDLSQPLHTQLQPVTLLVNQGVNTVSL